MTHRLFLAAALALSSAALPCFAQAPERYALFLHDQPARARVRTRLASRGITITGSADTLMNAVFVSAQPDQVDELRALPGVIGVVPLHRYRRNLSSATQLLNAAQAWALSGGKSNAGAGVKIGIIDTGIDQNHPLLDDPSLKAPTGFPKCSAASDCGQFTSGRVIVARSYVRQLPRPDDYSARDRSGHGTAVATCAVSMAPKVWLGSYKVFGSPDVNDYATDDVLIAALEDAVADGMDIVSLSAGGPALTGPLDTGAACGQAAGVPCDVAAYAFEQMARKGVLIVASAGNQGPTLGSIASPGDAPSVLTVGSVSNTHAFTPALRIPGDGVPADLAFINVQPTDAFPSYGAHAAPMRDVEAIAGDAYACSALPAGSLTGVFALIERDGCEFAVKMANAVAAGASGVLFYDSAGDPDYPFVPTGLGEYRQPTAFLSNTDGMSLKAYLAKNPWRAGVIDPAGYEADLSGFADNRLVFYSSAGPSTGLDAIKPDVLAIGGGSKFGDVVYMGAQSFDPLGDLYSASGYVAAAGTSFATPMVAGAAALVKQAHPNWSAAQIKSALVNTASTGVMLDDAGDAVSVLQTGAGKIAADLAMQTTVAAEPATISFGDSHSVPLRLTNMASAAATLSVDGEAVTIAAGASATVNVPRPAGAMEGAVNVTGGKVPLRIPFAYVAPAGNAATLIPLLSGDNDRQLAFRLVDANGVAVAGAPVSFEVAAGGAPVTLTNVSAKTDAFGVARALVVLGLKPGTWAVNASSGSFGYTFTGLVRVPPSVAPPGNMKVAPGSYFTIYGKDLSDTTRVSTTVRLPLAVDHVTVSFDSYAAHILFVSPTQINIQAPWGLQGKTSAQLRVSVGEWRSSPVTVAVADAVPEFFENPLGSNLAAAVDPANTTAPVVTTENPVKRGTVVSLFLNGLGAVSNAPESGEAASTAVLARTVASPAVTIGGVAAEVLFCGLTPGLPGLYQVNVVVPASAGVGKQPVTLSIAGQAARTVLLPLK